MGAENENTGDGAKAGTGDPPGATEPSPPRRKGRRHRGEVILDESLKRLAREVGKNKLAPDVSAEERYYSRSLTIRNLILEFLVLNEGSTWANLPELHARAANYAGCSSVTASRWVHQYTRVGARHRLVQATDHWILERRE